MTQSFDEFIKEYKTNHGCLPNRKWYYEAGAQSRQGEVDELKATIVKYEAGLRKNKANKHKLLAKNIELQKRIDEALVEIAEYYQEDGMTDLVFSDIDRILKGEE